ncbi:MAG TPA: ABC transporter ATP-binding protein [Polyangiaceae bacterium]|jgi:ABC-2 type transport system ATP-binding protein
MTPPPLLSISSASKEFRTAGQAIRALEDVSLTVRAGERVALLGRNGAGKSTLIKCVGSLVELDRGEIHFEGEPVARSPRYLGRVGFTLEGSRNVYWRQSAYENVRYFASLRGGSADPSRIERLLELFEIPAAKTKDVGQLSTGNRQKVAIACALAHDPALLLLDEPTLGLDVEAVHNIKRIVKEAAEGERARAFVITSHDLSFVSDVCERVAILEQGKVVYDGPLSVLRAGPRGYAVKLVLDGAADTIPAEWADGSRAEVRNVDGKISVEFAAGSPQEVFDAFARLDVSRPRGRVLDVDVSKSGLEAAYLSIARGEG